MTAPGTTQPPLQASPYSALVDVQRCIEAIEQADAYEAAMEEAQSPQLTAARMWEIVCSAFPELPDQHTLADLLSALSLAKVVLERHDCPADLLMFVVTHPSPNRFLRQNVRPYLVGVVLARPDCPDELKAAHALSALGGEGRSR